MPSHEFDECRAVLHKMWSNMGSSPSCLRTEHIPQRLEALMCGEFRYTPPPPTEPKGSHEAGFSLGFDSGMRQGRRKGHDAGYRWGMQWGFIYGIILTVLAYLVFVAIPASAAELTVKHGDSVTRCLQGDGTTECVTRELPPDPSACTDGLTLVSLRKYGVLTHVCVKE